MFIPSWRGWLALAAGLADAAFVPGLTPTYFWAGFSVARCSLPVLLLAAATLTTCVYSFRTRRIADCVAAFITAAFAAWLFYGFVVRIHQFA
jgi:hypothetical protein